MKLELDVKYPEGMEFETRLERINLDEEKKRDMASGKGFIINEPVDIKKSLVLDDSIYSKKFMKSLQDPDAYADRYSCDCKKVQGKDYEGMICPNCHSKVRYVGEDFEITGWIELGDTYAIIHPNLYRSIAKFIGEKTLESILQPVIDLDADGNPVTKYSSKIAKSQNKLKYRKTKLDDTYNGIGMIEFQEKFDEIMAYFKPKRKNKLAEYEDIMKNRDKVFIHNIPVYSTGLRPFKVEGKRFTFEGTNSIFNMMAKIAGNIRNDALSIYKIPKYRKILLWNMQEKYNALYKEVEKICAGKKGIIKNLIGGRCSFTSRSVIVPDYRLRVDEVSLSYHALLELLQQTVINILVRTYNIGYNDAYMRFRQAQIQEDPIIRDILNNIIKVSGGIPVLVNRNPTIEYGSIKAMKCVAMNTDYDYTMGLPLQSLATFAADFDGDCLNIYYVPNDNFWKSAMEIFNPRNAMMISRNDGMFNNSMNVFKDIVINANSFIQLSRRNYSPDNMNRINALREKYQ